MFTAVKPPALRSTTHRPGLLREVVMWAAEEGMKDFGVGSNGRSILKRIRDEVAKTGIGAYMQFDNYERKHPSLNYKTLG